MSPGPRLHTRVVGGVPCELPRLGPHQFAAVSTTPRLLPTGGWGHSVPPCRSNDHISWHSSLTERLTLWASEFEIHVQVYPFP